jgi:sphingolipid delta-4 desaturase
MEHHQFQGDLEKDVDLPTDWEGRFFTNTPLKALWLLMQPLFYALRPMIVRPKAPRTLDIINTVSIVISDLIVFYFFGPRAVLYLALSTLLGMGFHPVAGHFIAEHYVFVDDGSNQETFSYYGRLNYICWNVGYHNEHHDFPRIPGWRLPEVTKIAPEFYLPLKHYSSWTTVLYNYIFDRTVSPFSRVVRGSRPNSMNASDSKKSK